MFTHFLQWCRLGVDRRQARFPHPAPSFPRTTSRDSSVAGNGLTDVRRTVRADRDGDEPRIMSTLRNEVALLSEQSRVVVLTERLRIVDGIERSEEHTSELQS